MDILRAQRNLELISDCSPLELYIDVESDPESLDVCVSGSKPFEKSKITDLVKESIRIFESSDAAKTAKGQVLLGRVTRKLTEIAEIPFESKPREESTELISKLSSSAFYKPCREVPIDLDYKDEVGYDPYHMRDPVIGPPLIERNYNPKDYEQLFSFLDLAALTRVAKPDGILEPFNSYRIPQILHFIWIGNDFKREDFRHNIEEWITGYEDYTRVLWTDNREMSTETLDWCRFYGLKLIHIDDVFSGSNPMECEAIYRLERGKLPPNFGGASDILRYNIIYRFGGIYSDVDNRYLALAPQIKAPSFETWRSPDYLTCYLQVSKMKNDFIAVCPNYSTIGEVFKGIHQSYQYSQQRVCMRGPRPPWIEETIARTGPIMFEKKLCWDYEVFYNKKSSGGSAKTWVVRSWQAIPSEKDRSDLNFLRKRIWTNVFWDLRNVPKKLDFSKYQPYWNCFPNPVEEEKTLFYHISRYYPDLFSEIEQIHSTSVDNWNYYNASIDRKLNARDMLLTAAERGNFEIFKHFIETLKYNPDVYSPWLEQQPEPDGSLNVEVSWDNDYNRCGGYYPIHFAVRFEHIDIVNFLLDSNPSLLNQEGKFLKETPLELAVIMSVGLRTRPFLEILKVLIDKGAKLPIRSIGYIISYQECFFMWLAKQGHEPTREVAVAYIGKHINKDFGLRIAPGLCKEYGEDFLDLEDAEGHTLRSHYWV